MGVVFRRFAVTQAAQSFDHCVLCLGLAGINHVINFGYVAKVRMLLFTITRRNPAIFLIGIMKELAIAEVASQQSKLPHVVSNVFADITYGSIGANNNLLIFLCDLCLCG